MRIPREYVFEVVKGYTGRSRNCFSVAVRAAMYSLKRSKLDRRHRERRFQAYWNVRTNAASREWDLPFSCFIHGLRRANVRVDRWVVSFRAGELMSKRLEGSYVCRKNLAALAMTEPITFKCLIDEAQRLHKVLIMLLFKTHADIRSCVSSKQSAAKPIFAKDLSIF